MRILITIPHYFNHNKSTIYGSSNSNPDFRADVVSRCISSLHHHFSSSQFNINYLDKTVEHANIPLSHVVDIFVCTTGNYTLLENISLFSGSFTHVPTNSEPMMLGFECREVLKSHLGKYDYYCYMEDDLIIADPHFFLKLKYFTMSTGPMNVLQPNRYEVSRTNNKIRKCYIDGDVPNPHVATFYNISGPEYSLTMFDNNIRFQQPLNPHAGCYFLNAEQFEYWAKQLHFLDRDISFVGPLESAATLGIMKTFNIYKPSLENMNYFEIEHSGDAYLQFHSQFVRE